MNTVRLTAETQRLAWISDTYDDDLPYWMELGDHDQLVIPYTLEANDMRFATAPGYITGEQFYQYLKDAFDVLYAEGKAGRPAMMSIGLHCRLIGRPGKIAGLKRFIDYIQTHENVWCPRRIDIAQHWATRHPHTRRARPSQMQRGEFVAQFGSIFEHSPWIAERAHALELGAAHDTAAGLANALTRMFRERARQANLPLADSATPIQPVLVGTEDTAVNVSNALFEQGFWVPAIRPPTVPPGTARLRITLSAAHTPEQVDGLLAALERACL